MGCLPYLKFYPADWLSDATVRRMSPAARGAYFDLLMVAWNEGHIPDPPTDLAGWLGFTPRRFAAVWEEIKGCWVHGKDGQLVNPRQERERSEALAAHAKRKQAGRKGGLSK